MIENREATFSESARQRTVRMMADLDTVLLHLPDDPPDDIVTEVDRIVTTLRNADANMQDRNESAAMQMLDLAQARIDRFARRLSDEFDAQADTDNPDADDPAPEADRPDGS